MKKKRNCPFNPAEARSEQSEAAGPKLYKAYSEGPRTKLCDAYSEAYFFRNSLIPAAALRPSPMARMTVAAPSTMSPPA